jgi:hypothetical protein
MANASIIPFPDRRSRRLARWAHVAAAVYAGVAIGVVLYGSAHYLAAGSVLSITAAPPFASPLGD